MHSKLVTMHSKLKTQNSKLFWLQLFLIIILAFLPRINGLNDFYTIDEGYHWPGRVERFSDGLANRDWAATNQTGHPGVTTMWLGALGRQIAFARGMSDPGWAGGGADYLAMLRLPLACMNALAVLVGFLFLRRLFPEGVAFLAAVLWASSPFSIAHSRILHLDALLSSFMTLSILALLLQGQRPSAFITQPTTFILSACFGGLALITKAPSLILLPFVGIVLYTQQRRTQNAELKTQNSIQYWLPPILITRYLLWLGIALLTAWLLWPAMWVDPGGSVSSIMREIIDNGGQPHHSGNYFLGQPLGDPGPLFYPAVVVLRSTPLSLIGLLVALGTTGWQLLRRDRRVPANMIALLAFYLLFGILLTMEAKKLDRYLLPIWPGMEIMAAYGLWTLWQALKARFDKQITRFFSLRFSVFSLDKLLLVAILLLQSWQLSRYAPYYMAYYNPLAGGGPSAEYVMLVGLGEGMDQVGAWLRTRPDLERGDVLSWIAPTLAPFVPKQVLVRDLRTEYLHQATSYAVLYVRSVQHKENAAAEAIVRENPALYTVSIHGIAYASIHQLPRPFDTALNAQFGDDLALLGFSQQQVGSTLVITPSWSVLGDRPGGITAFIHVIDQAGQTIARVDAPLDQGMFKSWQAGQKFDSPLPLTLPSEQASHTYRIVLGIYEPGGTRLPLTRGQALPIEIDGPHVLELVPRE